MRTLRPREGSKAQEKRRRAREGEIKRRYVVERNSKSGKKDGQQPELSCPEVGKNESPT